MVNFYTGFIAAENVDMDKVIGKVVEPFSGVSLNIKTNIT